MGSVVSSSFCSSEEKDDDREPALGIEVERELLLLKVMLTVWCIRRRGYAVSACLIRSIPLWCFCSKRELIFCVLVRLRKLSQTMASPFYICLPIMTDATGLQTFCLRNRHQISYADQPVAETCRPHEADYVVISNTGAEETELRAGCTPAAGAVRECETELGESTSTADVSTLNPVERAVAFHRVLEHHPIRARF